MASGKQYRSAKNGFAPRLWVLSDNEANMTSRFFVRRRHALPFFRYLSESVQDGFTARRPLRMNRGLFVTRGSRRNRNSEDLSLFAGEFLDRRPLSIPKGKNYRPIQFWNGIFVALRICKTSRRTPSALMWPDPVRARTHNHRPNTALSFFRASLHELIRKNRKRSRPQVMVVFPYQFRRNSFKEHRFVFDIFHKPILQCVVFSI
jgi:hypothetical protein